ncbi:MAG: hypothetical protein E4H28_00070 [Gemmatimonadales bacterium]|nr:MAG: hypothetical protein E4H28_00070 [Gemmatimonadales bacterium]
MSETHGKADFIQIQLANGVGIAKRFVKVRRHNFERLRSLVRSALTRLSYEPSRNDEASRAARFVQR